MEVIRVHCATSGIKNSDSLTSFYIVIVSNLCVKMFESTICKINGMSKKENVFNLSSKPLSAHSVSLNRDDTPIRDVFYLYCNGSNTGQSRKKIVELI